LKKLNLKSHATFPLISIYRTGEGYSEEVAGGDGETNGEGGAALHIGGIVLVGGGREHGEHQHHRDQELNAQGLKKRGG